MRSRCLLLQDVGYGCDWTGLEELYLYSSLLTLLVYANEELHGLVGIAPCFARLEWDEKPVSGNINA